MCPLPTAQSSHSPWDTKPLTFTFSPLPSPPFLSPPLLSLGNWQLAEAEFEPRQSTLSTTDPAPCIGAQSQGLAALTPSLSGGLRSEKERDSEVESFRLHSRHRCVSFDNNHSFICGSHNFQILKFLNTYFISFH